MKIENKQRDQMSQALKNVVVPLLRQRGFTGTFPHFRRLRSEHIDLFTFQFDRNGGGFIVEIGRCEPAGFTTYWGKQISPKKVTAWDLPPKQRARIQPRAGSGTDAWFRFDGNEIDVFTRRASSVIPFVEQAEKMFAEFERIVKID